MRRAGRLPAVLLALALVTTALAGVATAGVGAASTVGSVGAAASAQDGTSIDHDGEAVTFQAGPGQAVRGESALPAGTTLSVRVRSAGQNPFLKTAPATVDQDGEFRAVFDFAEVQPEAPFEVVVHHDGTTLVEADGEVVACTDACGATTPDEADAELDAEELTHEAGPGAAVTGSTNLPPGSELAVVLRSSEQGNPFVDSELAIVDAAGEFRAMFDLSDAEPNSSVLWAVNNATRIAEAEGRVVACTDACGTASGDEDASNGSDDDRPVWARVGELGVVEATQGEVARIPVPTGEDGTAGLSVGAPGMTYRLAATVRDGDGDGAVTVLLDTGVAGRGGDPVRAANDSDEVSLDSETDLPDDRVVLDEGEYPLGRYRDPGPTGEPAGIGTLVLRDAPGEEDEEGALVVDYGFSKDVHQTPADGPVRIPVNLDESNVVSVVVGAGFQGYTLAATVRDGNGDERVVLEFDASAAGTNASAPALTAADAADTVTVTRENGSLAAREYRLSMRRGADAGVGGANESKLTCCETGSLVVAQAALGPGPSLTITDDAASGFALPGGTAVGALAVGGLLAVLGLALLLGVVEL